MEKIEFQHLTPYLPFGLKIECQKGSSDFCFKGLQNNLSIFNIEKIEGETWKPLLHPISNLDTEHILNDLGGKLSDNIFDFTIYFDSDNSNKDVAILQAPYPVIEWCLKHHYDVFGLIPSGLAVSL